MWPEDLKTKQNKTKRRKKKETEKKKKKVQSYASFVIRE